MKYFRDFTGNYFITENGGIGWRRNPQDGHGGRAVEHRQEMEQIADAIVQKRMAEMIPELQREAYQTAMRDLVTALEFDVQTVVEVAFENGERIFRDSKTQKVIAEKITKELKKRLSSSLR